MPRASKFRVEEKQLENINSHLLFLLTSLDKESETKNFLEEFLTKEEKIMLAKRLVLYMMLKRNYPPHVIQSVLHVSYETVRSYQNHLETKSTKFHELIDKLIKRQETSELFAKIDKLLKPLELALSSKSDMKARAKFLSGDY